MAGTVCGASGLCWREDVISEIEYQLDEMLSEVRAHFSKAPRKDIRNEFALSTTRLLTSLSAEQLHSLEALESSAETTVASARMRLHDSAFRLVSLLQDTSPYQLVAKYASAEAGWSPSSLPW